MDEIQKPLVGFLYKHFKGDTYICRGFAFEEKTENEVVIYSSVTTGRIYTRPLSDFFAEHPKLKIPRFVLVTPK